MGNTSNSTLNEINKNLASINKTLQSLETKKEIVNLVGIKTNVKQPKDENIILKNKIFGLFGFK